MTPLRSGEGRPLAGRCVLVTRAREQAPALARRLEKLGAEVIEAPAIRIADPPDWGPLDAALGRLATYDWIVFTSQNTPARMLARMRALGVGEESLRGPRLVAIGEATAAGLRACGLRADAVAGQYRAEGVVELLAREPLGGRRVLLPRALVARDVLPDALRERGAVVDVAPVYRTVSDPEGAEAARRAIGGRGVDAVTFTASSTVTAFLGALRAAGDPGLLGLLGRTCLASIGPVTSDRLRAEGLTPAVEAAPHTVPALVEAIVAHFGGAAGHAAKTEDR